MPRTLSPYAFAELNLKETASGLRGGRIPKPVYVQVKPKMLVKSPVQDFLKNPTSDNPVKTQSVEGVERFQASACQNRGRAVRCLPGHKVPETKTSDNALELWRFVARV